MISTIWGSTNKPATSKVLSDLLGQDSDLEGTLYIGYPIIGTSDGAFPLDALLVSPQYGLVLFNLVEGISLPDYKLIQDDCYNKMNSKLIQHKTLVSRRALAFEIYTVTFAPAVSNIPVDSDYIVCNTTTLLERLKSFTGVNAAAYAALMSVIQSVSNLRQSRKKRSLQDANSKGSIVKALEDSIANLDRNQSEAVVETFKGVQRLRGLAGCGKTVVLALKVAYLHSINSEWVIGVTFNTRSLKKQFEQLIRAFVIEQTTEEPDWSKIRIINAWGAPGGKDRTGIYYEFCVDHGLLYMDYATAKRGLESNKAFERACESALTDVGEVRPKFDAILIDEAQDFAPNFLRLCYEYLKPPKLLVYAYDELQNLGKNSLPPAEEIFGVDKNNNPNVVIKAPERGQPKQDITLDVCYRNSRPLLTTAHALGFGIYRKEGLTQIFQNKQLWYDIGYECSVGTIGDGVPVSLRRTVKTSPKFLEDHSEIDDLLQFVDFKSEREQSVWLAEQIENNIVNEELLPDDILVINPDPLTTRDAVSLCRKILMSKGINSCIAGVTTIADVFSESGSVTFTGIHRAKGNEAPMVYVINAQDCYSQSTPKELAMVRNRLFTAITRSKAWVRVLGVGDSMVKLKEEYLETKKNDFQLTFTYPTVLQQEALTKVNRDMSTEEIARGARVTTQLSEIVEVLKSGQMYIDDLSPDLVEQLRSLITKTNEAK